MLQVFVGHAVHIEVAGLLGGQSGDDISEEEAASCQDNLVSSQLVVILTDKCDVTELLRLRERLEGGDEVGGKLGPGEIV